jgi:hypothetical protein
MKKAFIKHLPMLIGSIFLAACIGNPQADPTKTQASPSNDLQDAQESLFSYFEELTNGDYTAAADRYGGELEMLRDWNADIDPADLPALFEAACSRQLQCLPVHSIVYARQVDENNFRFNLEFTNSDGSVFVLGPCCGASETEMPPVSRFDCSVEKRGAEDYKVMCLPVYVP